MQKKLVGIIILTLLIASAALPAVGSVNSEKMSPENTISYNLPPVADAGGPYEGVEGIEIMFDASASYDPDGDELSFRWDFDGDGLWDTDWSEDPITLYAFGDDYDSFVFVEVSDGLESTFGESRTFVVNADPEVDAGPDQVVNLGETVVYNGFFDDLGVLDDHVFSWAFGGLCADINGTNATVQCIDIEVGYGHEWKCNITTNGEKIYDLHFYMSVSDMDDSFQNGQGGVPSGFPEPPKHNIDISTSGHGMDVTFDGPLPDNYQFTLYTSVKNIDEVEIYWTTTKSGGKPTNHGVMSKPNSPIGPFEKIYNESGFYNSVLTIFDDDGGSATDTMTVQVNNPPNPPTITGQTSGKTGKEYEYTFNAIDIDGDDVKYFINWGETNPEWTGYNASGIDVKVKHTWSNDGTYSITAKAQDIHGAEGAEETLTVEIPRARTAYRSFLLLLFERFPNLFPVLRYLLEFQ